MIEFLKELPLGISVPYLMFKFTDNIRKYISAKNLDSFLFRLGTNITFLVYKHKNHPNDITMSFYGNIESIKVPSNIICIPHKESKEIPPDFLEPIPLVLVVNDRKIIDDFYENVEEEYKNGDLTKLILNLGKDPFNYCDIFFNDQKYGELFKSLSEDFITAILKEPSLWS